MRPVLRRRVPNGWVRSSGADCLVAGFINSGDDFGVVQLSVRGDHKLARWKVSETVFDLPVEAGVGVELVHGDYWGKPQPLFAAGLRVDKDMRPVTAKGAPVYQNLHAAGGLLAGAQRTHEKSGEGIALGSAATAVAAILRRNA